MACGLEIAKKPPKTGALVEVIPANILLEIAGYSDYYVKANKYKHNTVHGMIY